MRSCLRRRNSRRNRTDNPLSWPTCPSQFLKQAGPLESDLKVKAAEFAALRLVDEPNEDQIIAKAKEINAIKEQLVELRRHNRIAMLKILPPEARRMLRMPGFQGPGQMRHGARAGQF